MGKTKLFTEQENNSNGGNPTFRHNSRRRNIVKYQPGTLPPEQLPLGVLLRQIVIRLRRWWIALRFQADRLTMGLFRKQSAFRLMTLAVVAYILIGTDIWSSKETPDTTYGKSILAEQKLDGADVAKPVERRRSVKPAKEAPTLKKSVKTTASKAAPVNSRHLANADEQTRAYIERFSKIARIEMEKYGVPASISLAQGLIESRAGASSLARNNNNHFGIKCFQRNCRQGHCTNHTDDSHKDFFRNFPNAWESWRAHSIMITTGRYAKLKKYGRDYKRWAYGLKKVGYATDRNYDGKLIGVIERYGLYRYDR
jgi:flagellum-specific peptidoglycan hydrolase FlgJ